MLCKSCAVFHEAGWRGGCGHVGKMNLRGIATHCRAGDCDWTTNLKNLSS